MSEMINDVCDHCFREFGREPGTPAICPNCGLENVRDAQASAAPEKPANADLQPPAAETAPESPAVRESAMLAPAAEKAVLPAAAPRSGISEVPAKKERTAEKSWVPPHMTEPAKPARSGKKLFLKKKKK